MTAARLVAGAGGYDGGVPSIQLPADRRAASRARRFVVATLEGWGMPQAVIDDCELLTSELVTNAVLHARSESRLRIERRGDNVWVAVHDASPSEPRVRDYGPNAVTGRGLMLVDRLAGRWGSENDAHGKFVWFELPARIESGEVLA